MKSTIFAPFFIKLSVLPKQSSKNILKLNIFLQKRENTVLTAATNFFKKTNNCIDQNYLEIFNIAKGKVKKILLLLKIYKKSNQLNQTIKNGAKELIQ